LPHIDLSSHAPWLESKRRSHARRAEARRDRRWLRGRRSGVTVAVLSLTLAAGGAFAQDRASTGGAAAARPSGSASTTALQRALGIPADGVYGHKTRAAVRRFQAAHHLTVDGIAGPATLRALGLSGTTATARTAPTGAGAKGMLARIAACESGGDPTAVSSDGRYRGKYQFSRATWRALGGHGDPAAASEAEQDRRAAALLAARGTAPWPVCAA
jgi:peptidoglycan hydrolase-like protein with peptidoglycan-binding domain